MGTTLNIFENRDLINNIPTQPGVYIIRTSSGEILYVGKAKNLKNRIKSYLAPSHNLDIFKASMVREAHSVEIMVVSSELEALLLESNLIKEHRPPYNVVLKDDKSYPYLRISLTEKFPRLSIARRIKQKGDFYFGPITPVEALRNLIKLLKSSYKIAQKNDKQCQGASSPCIYYQMGKCSAPCVGYITQKEYMKMINEIKSLLSNPRPLKKKLQNRLQECIDSENFEEAIQIRDKLKAIELLEKGQSVSEISSNFCDVVVFEEKEAVVCAYIVNIRFSNIVGNRSYFFYQSAFDSETKESFILQYYSSGEVIPDEIVVDEIENAELVKEAIETLGKKVKIVSPKRGKLRSLVEIAKKNATLALKMHTSTLKNNLNMLSMLKETLSLDRMPYIIDTVDISHTGFENVVSGVVRYTVNGFEKDSYRRYSLESKYEADAMKETLMRHKRLLLRSYKKLPDLILVDGGIVQLKVAQEIFGEGKALAISKEKTDKTTKRSKGDVADKVYFKGEEIEIDEELLKFLQKLRDEAHRFAVTYHRKKRQKYVISSVLDRVEFLGSKRKKLLLEHFGSIEALKKASVDEIASLKGIPRKVAEALKEKLKAADI